jgi:diguanylate cyclase (GGDEF)-like protein/PAS domain S-box-containing protein
LRTFRAAKLSKKTENRVVTTTQHSSSAPAQPVQPEAADLLSCPWPPQTELENRWLAVLDALPDLMFEVDLQGRYLDFHSPRAELLLAPPELFLGKTLQQMLPQVAADIGMAALQEAHLNGLSRGKKIELHLPQGVSWFELSVSRKANGPDRPVSFIVLSRDITHRVVADHKLQRLTQLYSALSQCNQAIVRCQSAAELFPAVCAAAVSHGGMKMAWIGALDSGGQHIVPAASAGGGTDYLDGIVIKLDASAPSGRGPSGTAMRENRPVWCQDFRNDPDTQVWHERAQRYGWGASAALPLHLQGQVTAVLTVYADEAHAFDDVAQSLLIDMAADISFTLDGFAAQRERMQMEVALAESEERYRKAFHNSPDAVIITRLSDGQIVDINNGFERITGWHRDEVLGRTVAELKLWLHPTERSVIVAELQQHGRLSNMEAEYSKKGGHHFSGLVSAEIFQFRDITCIFAIIRDISDLRKADERIAQLAHFDQLTGLPNRSQLQERFKLVCDLAQRSGDTLALMFLDLDHFKDVNDTLGHTVGDQLLVEVSRRLSAVLRDGDTLTRMGGDEFILLLPAVNEDSATQMAMKLLAVAAQPYQIDRQELVCTLSIGIAIYPNDGLDFETLSKNADTAMYRVKQAGHNNFCFFTHEMQAHSARTLQLGNAMHRALARGEFVLHYQPQMSLQNGSVVGVEALLRWFHPELGLISPAEFIPIAEDNGQILAIGEWVLRAAVAQLKQWLDAGMQPMVMAVNLSAVQFRHPNLLALVTQILEDAALPAKYLELELTEAMAMHDPLAAIALMNQLHEHGIRMSIDDFGTGYSSLSYLKKFNIYKLKIDQSFVRDLSDDPDDKAIVTAIINLASSLGMHTIAEGVETASQLAFLRLQGCDEVQGYYFSKPLPAAQLAAFVKQQATA